MCFTIDVLFPLSFNGAEIKVYILYWCKFDVFKKTCIRPRFPRLFMEPRYRTKRPNRLWGGYETISKHNVDSLAWVNTDRRVGAVPIESYSPYLQPYSHTLYFILDCFSPRWKNITLFSFYLSLISAAVTQSLKVLSTLFLRFLLRTLVYLTTSTTPVLLLQVALGYGGLLWILESNFQDYVSNMTGSLGASVLLHPLVRPWPRDELWLAHFRRTGNSRLQVKSSEVQKAVRLLSTVTNAAFTITTF